MFILWVLMFWCQGGEGSKLWSWFGVSKLKKKYADLIKGFLLSEKPASDTIDQWIATAVRVTLRETGEHLKDLEQNTRYKLILDFREQKFRGDCKLENYVWRIAANTCIDYLRTKGRTPKCESIDDVKLEPVDTSENPLDTLISQEERAIFEKIFSHWSAECRQLLKLYSDGFAPKEIGKKLSIAESTVRTRWFRCKEMAINLGKKLIGEGTFQ
jgi:RNA polymerase sigma factor (sigma-70 family)